MKTLFRQLKLISYCFNFFIIFSIALNASDELEQEITLKVYNVGQGNLIVLKVPVEEENKPSEYMMVDIGSSSYAREWKYQKEKQAENLDNLKKEEKENYQTPLRIRPLIVPQTNMKSPDLEDYDVEEAKSDPIKIMSFIEDLRKELKNEVQEKPKRGRPRKNPPKPSLNIKTVVLTHPDYDHYGWLTKFFSKKGNIECTVSNLIFGGVPKDYFPLEDNNINENKVNEDKRETWLDFLRRLSKDTRIYFPAISKEPIKVNALEDISNGKYENVAYTYDEPDRPSMFGEAFEFPSGLRVYCLGANPTYEKRKKSVIRLSDIADSNSDSLVLKIIYGSMSAILTGDATRITTDCIIDSYTSEFLKSNLLIASHHGSSTHGSNEQKWIKVVNPECIFVSNGLLYGHPSSEAYENFKSSMRLKFVSQKHEILVAEEKGSYQIYETNRSIFSTLSSGNLEAIFTKNSFKIKTQKHGNIGFINLPLTGINDVVTFVEVNQNLDEVIATPKKENSSRKLDFNVNESLENETSFLKLPDNIPSVQKEETVPLKKDGSKTKLKKKIAQGKK